MVELTKQERIVLIFVGAAAFFGASLSFYQKSRVSLDIGRIVEGQKFNSVVNINKINFNDLAKIPAVGPTLAEAIIDFRSRSGPFKSLEELRLIKGINQNKFNQIKSLFTLE